MVIAALLSFAGLLIAWALAPEDRDSASAAEPADGETFPLAA